MADIQNDIKQTKEILSADLPATVSARWNLSLMGRVTYGRLLSAASGIIPPGNSNDPSLIFSNDIDAVIKFCANDPSATLQVTYGCASPKQDREKIALVTFPQFKDFVKKNPKEYIEFGRLIGVPQSKILSEEGLRALYIGLFIHEEKHAPRLAKGEQKGILINGVPEGPAYETEIRYLTGKLAGTKNLTRHDILRFAVRRILNDELLYEKAGENVAFMFASNQSELSLWNPKNGAAAIELKKLVAENLKKRVSDPTQLKVQVDLLMKNFLKSPNYSHYAQGLLTGFMVRFFADARLQGKFKNTNPELFNQAAEYSKKRIGQLGIPVGYE